MLLDDEKIIKKISSLEQSRRRLHLTVEMSSHSIEQEAKWAVMILGLTLFLSVGLDDMQGSEHRPILHHGREGH
jgi:hypothetical protein